MITGHRGAMAVEPENTLRSFRRAVRDGANEIELDLRLSRDKQLVVMHDELLDRTSDLRGPVSGFSVEQLRAADAGLGEHVPTFVEVVDEIDALLQAEVKEIGVVDRLIEFIEARPYARARLFPTSFHADLVGRMAAALPDVEVGLIARIGSEDVVRQAQAIGARRVLFGWDGTTPELVAFTHERGLHYCVWPVNDADQLYAAARLAVDGFTTDAPAIVAEHGFTVLDGRLVAPAEAARHVS